LGIGITLVFLAQFGQIWDKINWNPGVFGAGVSITALGFTLLVAFWPLRSIPSSDTPTTSRATLRTGSTKQTQISKILTEFSKKHPIVILGFIATLIIFIMLLLLQYFLPSMLQLDVKWIVVACLPLIIALIVGGYIKEFGGFGITLKTTMEAPITSLDLKAQEVLVSLEGTPKDTIAALDRIGLERRRKITRLQFSVSRPAYYDVEAIASYMRALPNLEYFEIVKPRGLFVCLLPIWIFYRLRELDFLGLERFLSALMEDRVLDMYSDYLITDTVTPKQSLISVLEVLRSKRVDAAAVVGPTGAVLGLVRTSDIEKRITDEVIFEAKRKKKL
jgi:hypothetical protein